MAKLLRKFKYYETIECEETSTVILRPPPTRTSTAYSPNSVCTLQVYLRLYDGDQVSSVSGESDVYSRTETDPVFCFTSCAVSPQCSDSQYSSMASDGGHGSVDTDYTGCSDMSYTRLNTAVPASCLVTLTTPTVPHHTGQPHWHTLEIFW